MSRKFNFLGADGYGVYEGDPCADQFVRSEGSADTWLVPGFVDIHTHGAFGIDFMSATTDQMLELCQKLRACGYDGFLPTTVTASASDIKAALTHLPSDPMILGFHLEGPFISPKFPGAQPKEFIIDPPIGDSEWDEILDDPRLKVITMAPEQPGAHELIRRLSSRGVKVSMGHTNATYADAQAGLAAGASHTTHTYNAMRPLHHREAGTVGFALTTDAVFTELIYDRMHVSRPAAEVLIRCKPTDKVIAISDSVMAAGMAPGSKVRMWSLDVLVGENDVRLADGTLAGSGITLLTAFRNLHADFGPETAIRACCWNPRLALGMPVLPRTYFEFDESLSIVGCYEVSR